ncbi:MAG: sulfite exporter TauE/SafE family protein [Saprospiraceae bacterium]
MAIITISIAAFLVAILTFFSGFGLGTILTPVFILFFPVDLAIALTGVVHFCNNLFKMLLVGKYADKNVLIRFGIPAIVAAFAGAYILINITDMVSLYSYQWLGRSFEITPVKFIISIILIFFAVIELIPYFGQLQFGMNKLPFGGVLSGFFGGLSGHQGALRSAFLIKTGLSKEAFIGTSVVIASMIDITRLSVYTTKFGQSGLESNLLLVICATLSAISGAYIGNKLLKKITLIILQRIVAMMLILISIALGAGLI